VRLIVFGSGSPLSTAAFASLAERFTVSAVVAPAVRRGGRLGARAWRLVGSSPARPLIHAARRAKIPVLRASAANQAELAARLAPLSPDLICVASFPFLLRSPLLRLPRLGVVGIHPALLPRHRGGWPLFWTYFHDDPEAGVTVQWLDGGADTGDIIFQEPIPLPRGEPLTRLYGEITRRGVSLLVQAIDAIERGTAPRTVQDEARATRDPNPADGAWRPVLADWGAERLWHFLSGLGDLHGELLTGADGRPVAHGPVLRFSLEGHRRAPGTLERLGRSWRVYCRDGVVDTAGPTRRAMLRRIARKLR
jgi:methionyl-tRNA formyltransferase